MNYTWKVSRKMRYLISNYATIEWQLYHAVKAVYFLSAQLDKTNKNESIHCLSMNMDS